MTAGAATLLAKGRTGQNSSDSKKRYVGIYQVRTTDPLDGPTVALTASGLPLFGGVYSFGNDSDSDAYCTSLAPSAVEGSRVLWQIVATWETSAGEKMEGADAEGNAQTDPLLWHDEIDVQPVNYTRPVEKAKYISGYNGSANAILSAAANQPRPVCNSAFVNFDPPPERDDSRYMVRISKWKAAFPWLEAGKFQDAVNKNDYQINKPQYGFVRLFPKFTLKANISGAWNFVNGFSVWKITYELSFKRDGWREEYLDRGIMARTIHGDSDGLGGTISTSGSTGTLPNDGEPAVRRLVDKHEVPITEPVLFNGNGRPLKSTEEQKPIFGKWAIYEKEEDFAELVL